MYKNNVSICVDRSPEPEEKRKLSRKLTGIILAVAVICTALLGVYLAHTVAVNTALAPYSVILDQNEVKSLMSGSHGFMMPQFPNGSNIDSVDFTAGNPLPVFGGNVTSPNLAITILKNGSEESALSAFNYLKDIIMADLLQKIANGNVTTFGLGYFPYENVTFYNETYGTGALLSVIYSYVMIVAVFDSNLSVLKSASHLQADKIYNAVQYTNSHYLL